MKMVNQTSEQASALLLADEALMRADGDARLAIEMLRKAVKVVKERGAEE